MARMVSRREFMRIYEEALSKLDNSSDDKDLFPIYGANVIIEWNGIACNLGDGATVYNHIITNIPSVDEELDEEEEMFRFSLVNYFDVWGNEEDGWEVNNQCVEFDDLWISETCSIQDILDYLKTNGWLTTSNQDEIEVDDMGEVIEIMRKDDGCPLYSLRLEERR